MQFCLVALHLAQGVFRHQALEDQDPEEQEGNYLALQFDAAEGSTTTIELIGGNHPGAKPLDADMDAVFRITKNTQKIKVVTTAATGEVIERTLSLGRLNLEK